MTVTKTSRTKLPLEIADRFTEPLGRFLKIKAASGVVLFVSTCAALVLANSPWSASFLALWEIPVGFQIGSSDFTRSLQHWINDGLMTIFFFVIALELKRELVLGELRSMRTALLSFSGAIGGMVVPAVVYIALLAGKDGVGGWGTVMATDTAFVIGCLALLGRKLPGSLRVFLLSLAIFDDVGAILIVVIGYGDALSWSGLAAAALGVAIVFAAARIGIRSIAIYWILGIAAWLAFDASGLHPTVAGVVFGLMTPARGWVSDARLQAIFSRVLSYPSGEHWSGDCEDRSDLRLAERAARETLSPVEQLELMLHPWSSFIIMPLFALANAGVEISFAEALPPVSVAVCAGLAIGKPIGVFVFSWVAVRTGLASLPANLDWRLLGAGGLLTGIGFTMSLFIAHLAYSPTLLNAAKVGILGASVISAAGGLVALGFLQRRRRDSSPQEATVTAAAETMDSTTDRPSQDAAV
jgi:NhaA family Na+:H+ antiporter